MNDAPVKISAAERDGKWFGVAWTHDGFAATTVSSSRDGALAGIVQCLPSGVSTEEEEGSAGFVQSAVTLLAALENGDESFKQAVFSPSVLSGPQFRIYSAAAAIPIGYVTTYGTIALAARSEARAVGRAMATNPLYPLVPCHRVVGAGFSLVGYGGRQDSKALRDKLQRIRSETMGAVRERVVSFSAGSLRVFPGEWVVSRAPEELAEEQQLTLF